MKRKLLLLKLIGILILFLILRKIDFSLILLRIKNCNLSFLSAVFFIQLVVLAIRVVRWKYILQILKIRVSFLDALKAFWSGLYLAAITPAKIGELSRVYFLGKNNPSISRSLFSVVLDRSIDLVSLLLFALVASFIYLKELGQLNRILLISLIGLSLGTWIVFLKRDFFYNCFKGLVSKSLTKERLPLKENLNLDILKGIKIRNYVLIFGYVLLGWSVFFFGWWLLAKALHIELSFLKVIGVLSIATIVSVIPISIMGLGTRDASVVFMFSKMGIAKDSALSFSFLIFTIEILIVCLGIIFFLVSLRKKDAKNG